MMKEQNVRLHGMVLFLVVLTLRLVTDRLGILLVQHVTGAAQAAIVIGSQLIWLGAPLAVYLGIKRGKSVRFERVSPKVWLLFAQVPALRPDPPPLLSPIWIWHCAASSWLRRAGSPSRNPSGQ